MVSVSVSECRQLPQWGFVVRAFEYADFPLFMTSLLTYLEKLLLTTQTHAKVCVCVSGPSVPSGAGKGAHPSAIYSDFI